MQLTLVDQPHQSVIWNPDDSVVAVLKELRLAQLAAGGKIANQVLSPIELAANLSEAFAVATAARKWEPSRGRLLELLPDGYGVFDESVVVVSTNKRVMGL